MKLLKKIGMWVAVVAAAVAGFLNLRKKAPSQKELEKREEILDELNVRDTRAVRAEAERRREAARTLNPTSVPDETLSELLAKTRARRKRDDNRTDD